MESKNLSSPLTVSNNQFGNKLLKTNYNNGSELISPLSMMSVLIPTTLGSRGDTFLQMADVLGLTQENFPEILNDFLKLRKILDSKKMSDTMMFRLVNSLYVENSFPIIKNFEVMCGSMGKIEKVENFGKPEIRTKINEFISGITNKLIPELLPDGFLTNDTKLLLVNALYFKANWKKKFDSDSTSKKTFFRLTGEKVSMDMMSQIKNFNYFEDENMQMVELPYEENYDMCIIVPKGKLSNIFELDKCCNLPFKSAMVQIVLPKFTIKKKMSMKQSMEKLGARDIFRNDKADLTNISELKGLYVGDILHECVIKINEEGTEAAAATAVKFNYECAMMEPTPEYKIIADHTFQFFIKEKSSNIVLFAGIYDGIDH